MLNLIRKFLRPTLREQLEDGVREALRRYADRRVAPDLRVYVSTDLLPPNVEPELWAGDEAAHLKRFAAQWAQDNGISRAGLRSEVILLDTKREFAFVKPIGLHSLREAVEQGAEAEPLVESSSPLRDHPVGSGVAAGQTSGPGAVFEIVESPALHEPLRVSGEVTVGRKPADGILGTGDRYMSGRHARIRRQGGEVWVTDLDSKNRTYVNDQPLPPHQDHRLALGDTLRMGTTTLRLARVEG